MSPGGAQAPALQQVSLPPRGTRWIGTSWKMTKTRAEGLAWARTVAAGLAERGAGAPGGPGGPGGPQDGGSPGGSSPQVFVVPPATALAEVSALLAREAPHVLVGAQDAHWEDAGAWTGELSVPQVADAGAQLVEIGHSERREHFGDTDARVALKVRAALRHGLVPLLCVGESAAVRSVGGSVDHVLEQVRLVVDGLDAADAARVVLAYEPVWAIGASGRPARPEEVAEVVEPLVADVGDRVAGVLFGGSVDADGAPDLLRVPGVDGLFVGRAAWEADGFLRLVSLVAAAG
ncbi:triose-phosphate isomerase [uncultured Pseudokineococcus sp.]|uniref:triose-phosphate isomerase n=1 Tax=uncultured Pseudokineococcus sp. TaxID=1642928 RepID=UPI00261E11BC|nr:triose-phosphate isomerase [uncultured Pseudokineococcus sp.]